MFVEVGPQQTLTRLNRRILGAAADVIASDNPKRSAWEPLLGVQAFGVPGRLPGNFFASGRGVAIRGNGGRPPATKTTAAKTITTAAPNPSRTTAPLTATKGTTALSDQRSTSNEIPHFDATERRRQKMRSANGPVGSRGTNGSAVSAAKPKVSAAKPAAPVARPAPAPKLPPSAAKPLPATPVGANGNGASNGSAGHHPAAPIKPAPVAPAAHRHVSVEKNGSSQNGDSQTAVHAAGSPGRSAAELEGFLINFVVEQTGYPAEVVDLDADLEADLGIDSIKKAQLFGELQEYFDISALRAGGVGGGSLSLDDFTTLRHVLNFLVKSTPAASGNAATNGHRPSGDHSTSKMAQPAAAPVAGPALVAAENVATAGTATPGTSAAELEAFLINFVVEQTGYPAEVVDLDADLEADLGIDSIKKAQLFGELQEYFDISALGAGGAGGSLSLDDFTTLRHVLNFLVTSTPAASGNASTNGHHPTGIVAQPAAAPVAEPPPEPGTPDLASPGTGALGTSTAELEAFLINFVVEQTGYPAEVVDLDADLEADLGIDSIKKAQLFGELQEYFDISALGAGGAGSGSLSLDDFTTLRHVLDFLVQSQSGAAARLASSGFLPRLSRAGRGNS